MDQIHVGQWECISTNVSFTPYIKVNGDGSFTWIRIPPRSFVVSLECRNRLAKFGNNSGCNAFDFSDQQPVCELREPKDTRGAVGGKWLWRALWLRLWTRVGPLRYGETCIINGSNANPYLYHYFMLDKIHMYLFTRLCYRYEKHYTLVSFEKIYAPVN